MQPDMVIRGGPRQAGIYHLLRDGEVLYVGQSSHVMQRVATHCAVPFNEIHIFFCAEAELDDREQADIERLRPTLNRSGLTSPYHGQTRPARAFRVGDDYYTSPQDYLRDLPHVMRYDLRAIGLLKCAEDLDLLRAQGFPDPVAQRGRALFWSTPAVLDWLGTNHWTTA
jgi:hypothetical protein